MVVRKALIIVYVVLLSGVLIWQGYKHTVAKDLSFVTGILFSLYCAFIAIFVNYVTKNLLERWTK